MEHERFDALIRALGSVASRRGALGLLAGLAGLGLDEAAARRRRGRAVRSQAAKAGKVTLCHHDRGADTWHAITVSANAADKHKANHGDFEYDVAAGECCTGDDCGRGETCTIRSDAEGDGGRPGVCCPSAGVCTDHLVCGVKQVTCDPGPGTGCSCAPSVEGCLACTNENVCGPPCTSTAQCVADLGPGAICQAPGGGCCGQTCLWPCGQGPDSDAQARSGMSNASPR